MSFGQAHFNFKGLIEAPSNERVVVGQTISHKFDVRSANKRAANAAAASHGSGRIPPKIPRMQPTNMPPRMPSKGRPVAPTLATIARTNFVKAGAIDLSKRYGEVQANSSSAAGSAAYTHFSESQVQKQYSKSANARTSSNKRGLGGSTEQLVNKKLYNEFASPAMPDPHNSAGYWPTNAQASEFDPARVIPKGSICVNIRENVSGRPDGRVDDVGFGSPAVRTMARRREIGGGIHLAKSKAGLGPFAQKAARQAVVEGQIDALVKKQAFMRRELDRLCSIPYSDHPPTAVTQDEEVARLRGALAFVDRQIYEMNEEWDKVHKAHASHPMFTHAAPPPLASTAIDAEHQAPDDPIMAPPPSRSATVDKDGQLAMTKKDQFLDFDFSADTMFSTKTAASGVKELPVAGTSAEATALITRLASIIKSSDDVLKTQTSSTLTAIDTLKAAIKSTLDRPSDQVVETIATALSDEQIAQLQLQHLQQRHETKVAVTEAQATAASATATSSGPQALMLIDFSPSNDDWSREIAALGPPTFRQEPPTSAGRPPMDADGRGMTPRQPMFNAAMGVSRMGEGPGGPPGDRPMGMRPPMGGHRFMAPPGAFMDQSLRGPGPPMGQGFMRPPGAFMGPRDCGPLRPRMNQEFVGRGPGMGPPPLDLPIGHPAWQKPGGAPPPFMMRGPRF